MSFEARCEINEAVKHIQRACFQLLKYEGGIAICERLRILEREISKELDVINDDLEVIVRLPDVGHTIIKHPDAGRSQ